MSQITLILTGLLLIVSCNDKCQGEIERILREAIVDIQPSDDTSPILKWEVTNMTTGAVQTFSAATNTVNSDRSTTWKIVVIAEDPESGIDHLQMSPNGSYLCAAPGVGQSATLDGFTVIANIPDLGPGKSWKRWSLQENDVLFSFPCQQGFEFQSGSYVFNGEADNFAGRSAASSLAFDVH